MAGMLYFQNGALEMANLGNTYRHGLSLKHDVWFPVTLSLIILIHIIQLDVFRICSHRQRRTPSGLILSLTSMHQPQTTVNKVEVRQPQTNVSEVG
jgi:hypothetical protein